MSISFRIVSSLFQFLTWIRTWPQISNFHRATICDHSTVAISLGHIKWRRRWWRRRRRRRRRKDICTDKEGEGNKRRDSTMNIEKITRYSQQHITINHSSNWTVTLRDLCTGIYVFYSFRYNIFPLVNFRFRLSFLR